MAQGVKLSTKRLDPPGLFINRQCRQKPEVASEVNLHVYRYLQMSTQVYRTTDQLIITTTHGVAYAMTCYIGVQRHATVVLVDVPAHLQPSKIQNERTNMKTKPSNQLQHNLVKTLCEKTRNIHSNRKCYIPRRSPYLSRTPGL